MRLFTDLAGHSYGASTLYHSEVEPAASTLQLVDHCCIYLLIAGSYTPFLLVLMRDTLGFGLLAFVWAFALFGIAMKVIFRGGSTPRVCFVSCDGLDRHHRDPSALSDAGWEPLALVLGGGASYSLGVIFFGWHSLRHHHAILARFVLGGSILHYLAIVLFVLR